MFNKFQQTIIKILENNSVGSVLGQSVIGAEISNPTSINPDNGYTDNIKGALATALPNKLSKKKKKNQKSKVFPKILKRNLPETFLGK
jgi:hypothetical protein